MNNEISKKQFIIISIIVIVVTLIVVISIANSRSRNENILPEDTTPVATENDKPNSSDIDNNIDDNTNEVIVPIDNTEVQIDVEKDNPELNIDITSTSDKLNNLQNRIEVATNEKNKNILPEMITLSDSEINKIIGLDLNLLEDYVIRVAKDKFDVDMYIIVKPNEADKETVKRQINTFVKTYTNSWSKLNVEQYQLLENTKSVERNGYLIYIVSTDNETLMNVVRQFI